MTFAAFVAVCKSLGIIASFIVTLITLFTLISKKPRTAFRRIIREEAKEANEKIEKELEDIKARVDSSEETDLAILRNTITHIYFKYMNEKKIPHYEKENVIYLYTRYSELGGNHYVKQIVSEIEQWQEIV